MRPRRAPSGTDATEQFAAPQQLPGPDLKAREVAVARRQPAAVIHDDDLAVAVLRARELNHTVARRDDRRAALGRDVLTRVELRRRAAKRIAPRNSKRTCAPTRMPCANATACLRCGRWRAT